MSKKTPLSSSSLQGEHSSSISLTTFPTPRNQDLIEGRKDHIPLVYSSNEESRLRDIGTGSRSTVTAGISIAATPASSKQYWMPDHLCKVCYDCGLSFSLFKRRHHCRLCGQIFCYECSSHFIDGNRHGFDGNIRVCNFCFNYTNHGAPTSTSAYGSPLQQQLLRQQQQQHFSDIGSTHGDRVVPTPDEGNGTDLELSIPSSPSLLSPLVNSPSSRTFDELEKSDSLPLELFQQQLLLLHQEQQKRRDNSPPINIPSTKSSSSTFTFTDGSPSTNTTINRMVDSQKPSNTRRRRSSAELLDAIESTVDPLICSNVIDTSVMSEKDISNEQNDLEAHCDPELLEKHLKVAKDNIHMAVKSLCASVQDLLVSKQIDPIWFQKEVEDNSMAVVKNILSSMKFRSSDGFNYQHLVKVKAIPTTSIFIPNPSIATTSPKGQKYSNPKSPKDTSQEKLKPYNGSGGIASNLSIEVFPGTLCRKNLCHKQMPRHISNPRVLLLAGGISYDRAFDLGKLSSLDTLIEQEKSYMSILVDKILKLKPHVIFVGRTVSRYAQEFLKERGLALVVNVKSEILERIARHTGAVILTSTDHVDQSNPDLVLGSCRLFQVKNLPLVPETVYPVVPTPICSESSTSGAPSTPVPSGADQQRTKRGDTFGTPSSIGGPSRPGKTSEAFLFLEGCDPSNGFTVLLKGAFPKSQLKLIKEVLKKVLAFIYEQLLEARVLAALELPVQRASQGEKDRTLNFTKCMLRLQEQNNIKQKYVQCMMPNLYHFQMYTADKDLSLGHFILEEIHNFQVKCANTKCNYVLMDHVKTFHLADRPIVMLSFEELPPDRKRLQLVMSTSTGGTLGDAETIVFWRWCKECRALVSSFRRLDAYTHKFSFARSLELLFSPLESVDRRIKRSGSRESQEQHQTEIVKCQHQAESSHVMFFSRDKSVARLEYLCDTEGKPSYTSRLLVHTFDYEANITPQQELDFKEEEYVAGREETLRLLLEQVTKSFKKQIRQVQQMVDLPVEEQEDVQEEADETTGLLILELMCLYKSIDRDGNFLERKIGKICKIDQEEIENATIKSKYSKQAIMRKERLRKLNFCQREIYLFACQWMQILCNLQRTFKKKSAITSSTAALAISGATSVVSQMTSALLSPVHSPRVLSPSTNYSTESDIPDVTTELIKELIDEPALSINGQNDDVDETNSLLVSSLITKSSSAKDVPVTCTNSVSSTATTSASSNVSIAASTTHSTGAISESTIENSKSNSVPRWRSALGELHRMLGRGASDTVSEDDFFKFELNFPSELAAGHPSLPFSYKATKNDKVSNGSYVLVSDAEPITLVAYSLCSKQYEEEMDAMKVVVHEEIVAAADAVRNNSDDSKQVAGTNWARAALITGSLTSHFKFSIIDVPTHARILSGKEDTVQDWSKIQQQRRLSDSTENDTSISSILALSSELTCKAYYPLQFEVLRQLFYGVGSNESFSLAIANVKEWITGGGKSGATFFRSYDDRFVIKHITVTEMQSFLDVLPEYFKYMASIAFDGVDSVLSKTIGLYHTTILNRETGHKQHHYIAVLENVFYGKQVDQIYDLKGSSRNRYVKKNKHSSLPTTNNYETAERSLKEETKMATYPTNTLVDTFFPEKKKEESNIEKVQTQNKEPKLEKPVLLDGNFLEYTTGYPLGIDMKDHKKFLKAIKNDTAFLSSINIVDYSMIVGFDYNGKNENDRNPFNMTVGIIDYLRQFDFMKRMESVGKSVGMIAGQASPTIIEPALYSKRFVEAMQRYFMPVASMSLMKEKDKQTTI